MARPAARRRRAVGRLAYGGEDLGAGAEAAIEHAQGLEAPERGGVVRPMSRLAPDGAVPVEAEPGQVLFDGGDEGRAAADLVDILDAQNEATPGSPGGAKGGEGAEGVAAVEIARGRGGEAGDEGRDAWPYARCAPAPARMPTC
jgi:hypothetical protein